MFRVQFRLSLPSIEGTANVGEMFIEGEDLITALNTAKEKKSGLVMALRAAMPMLSKVKESDIEVGIFAYSAQLLFDFKVPDQKHSEVKEEEAAFELFVHDSDPTLSNQ
jgi:hypothetical protein